MATDTSILDLSFILTPAQPITISNKSSFIDSITRNGTDFTVVISNITDDWEESFDIMVGTSNYHIKVFTIAGITLTPTLKLTSYSIDPVGGIPAIYGTHHINYPDWVVPYQVIYLVDVNDVNHNHTAEKIPLADYFHLVYGTKHTHTAESFIHKMDVSYSTGVSDNTHTNQVDSLPQLQVYYNLTGLSNTLHTNNSDDQLQLIIPNQLLVNDTTHTIYSDQLITEPLTPEDTIHFITDIGVKLVAGRIDSDYAVTIKEHHTVVTVPSSTAGLIIKSSLNNIIVASSESRTSQTSSTTNIVCKDSTTKLIGN
jgi:hypothetical protein